jgi:hypothetical protein
MADYTIERSQSATYVDNSGNVVDGFRVFVAFPEFDELHRFNVPNLDVETVTDVAEKFLNQRRLLSDLGE